ncbi:MAG: glycosyltransferase [Spartobacteria bacterium]|nr:glycosyltransferase [Spartobacteria bacterium]
MSRIMKILMSLFTQRCEGTFYRAFPWASYLASRGHDVTILCAGRKNRFASVISMENGVRIIEMPSLFDGRRIMTRLCGMAGWGPLDTIARWREMSRGTYQIVHTFEHHISVSLPVYLAGMKTKPVFVADGCDHYGKGGFREVEYSPYRLHRIYDVAGAPVKWLMDFLERDMRRRADAVTVISSFLRQRMLDFGVQPERIHLIPGSADVTTIYPQDANAARERTGLPPGAYVLFFGAGQFDLDFSLEAFALLREERPDTRFIVVGKIDESVTQKAKQTGVLEHLIQTGWVDDLQLNDWLACGDICLLPMKCNPPNHARWPNKIGAYMAAGRPIVLTDVNDAGGLVQRENIGLTSLVSPADFAQKILRLLQNPAEAQMMGKQARYVAEHQFALPVHGAMLERLYQRLLEVHHA